MKRIIALTDYKGHFGSKWGAVPHQSGFDKKELALHFEKQGFKIEYVSFSEADRINDVQGVPVIYTSSEDIGYHYKQFIEDAVLNLAQKGAVVVPGFDFLRANNNKVYMELMRHRLGHQWDDQLKSWTFGTYDDIETYLEELSFPIVIKTATGAMSAGVSLANNEKELRKKIKKVSKTHYLKPDLRDALRPYFLYKGYKSNSRYRGKYILQQFIPNLKNDWKILIYDKVVFILTRHTRSDDFRASGSHENYLAGSKSKVEPGLFDFAEKVYNALDVPQLSIDVVFDGTKFHLIEFQAIYFGTSTINLSDVYFTKSDNGNWEQKPIVDSVEKLYADSTIQYLKKRNI